LYGNVVQIKHNFRGEIIYSVYAHMDSIAVKQGEKVKQGQRIGTV
jgi:murein DD-endopeptidase MepM/ murein hydrolase activator NlpD